MKILLVDADSKEGFANLALIKLSAWYKRDGDSVDLIKGIPDTAPLEEFDLVVISCVFYQNKERVKEYAKQFSNAMIGGSGYNYQIKLSDDTEHIMPDYSLYGYDYSLGFTSRGCIRSCKWCVVPRKEGAIRDHAPISEFHHPSHKKMVLLDNNFQASPMWRENIQYIQEHDLRVNFSQGLDIRILTHEFAEQLATIRYYDWKFKNRRLHFAFDQTIHENAVRSGIKELERVGIPAKHLMFYVLCGFNTTHEEDMYRVNVIKELGAKPYIMPYNQTKDKEVRKLARWINRRYYEFIPYQEFQK